MKSIEKPIATNPLAAKLKLKPGQHAAIIAAPANYLKELSPLPTGVTMSTDLKGKHDWIQIFVKNKAELERISPRAIQSLKPESILWISFPKGTSKTQTDLTRDKGWDVLQKADLKWITLISIDNLWSAFAMRPYRPGEAKQSFR
ncbi:MAG: hypothetical protein NTZ35_17850 [Ignavibacteriales bacterium]|nr:hypothetical protein [Ignavibacteriales bacterium]